MSQKGMGGDEYDDFLKGMEQHPGEMPDAIICSQQSMRELEEQFGMSSKLSCIGSGYAGQCLGVYVWIDNRFDQPLFLSGLKDD